MLFQGSSKESSIQSSRKSSKESSFKGFFKRLSLSFHGTRDILKVVPKESPGDL